MMRRGLAGQRLVAAFLGGAVIFNYPLLTLFDRAEPLFGLPMLWLSLFGIWAALIAFVALIVERSGR